MIAWIGIAVAMASAIFSGFAVFAGIRHNKRADDLQASTVGVTHFEAITSAQAAMIDDLREDVTICESKCERCLAEKRDMERQLQEVRQQMRTNEALYLERLTQLQSEVIELRRKA